MKPGQKAEVKVDTYERSFSGMRTSYFPASAEQAHTIVAAGIEIATLWPAEGFPYVSTFTSALCRASYFSVGSLLKFRRYPHALQRHNHQ